MVTDVPAIINRDASDKSKGFRYQKLRAVELLIEAYIRMENPIVYCKIENLGDVNFHDGENSHQPDYIEEDKNYAHGTNFSLNSPQILNTLVAFADIWISKEMSDKISFGFVTNAGISKEKNTERTHKLKISLPNEPILERLLTDTELNNEILIILKKLVRDEYEKQYKDKKSKGYLNLIKNWPDETWIAFLKKISWNFSCVNAKDLENKLISKLRKTKIYQESLHGKEGQVISLLVDAYDRKQNADDYCDKYLHGSELELIALKVSTNQHYLPDPAWQIWKTLPPPDDKRNVSDKFKAVVPNIQKIKLDSICRKTALSKLEQEQFKKDKTIYSLKYQVYSCCFDKIASLKEKQNSKPMELENIETWISKLTDCSMEHLAELTKDYTYPLKNKESIKGIVLDLIDTCFFAFDEGENGN